MSQKQLFATIPPVRIKFEKEQVAELLPLIDCVLDDPNDSIVIGQLLPGSYGQFRVWFFAGDGVWFFAGDGRILEVSFYPVAMGSFGVSITKRPA